MGDVFAESSSIRMALEATLSTAPGTGTWIQLQPNPGGIQGWEPNLKSVERDPLSKFASREKGDNVGLTAEPKLVQDLNKDLVDTFASGMFRVVAKHAGNKGQSLYRPTAVTSTGYTVAALGDLTNGLLIYARGFTTTANNGLKVLAGTSTTIEIKAPGLTAEAAPPSNVTVDVVGVQGASADITLNGSGNLTSTVLDFTTLGLTVGQWLKIGGTASNTFFATTAYNSRARIVSIAANLITLERRHWTVASADTGTGKTIQLFFSRFYRNTTTDHADRLTPTYHGELEDLGAGPAGVATYTYAEGNALKSFELDAPLESKIVCTASFVGTNIEDPVLVASRVTGPSTAYAPLAAALLDTATDLKKVRLTDATGELVAEINSWKLTIENNVKAKVVQGTFGAISHIHGKCEPSVTMEAYFGNYEATKARRDNRALQWDAYIQNHQVAVLWDLPNVALRGGGKTYAANEAVMISCDIPAFREESSNIVASLSVFGHIPE